MAAFALVLLLFLTACLSSARVDSSSAGEYVPIVYKIGQRQTECIYDEFEKNDFVTLSAFVVGTLNNGNPAASVKFEGPLLDNQQALDEIGAPPRAGDGKLGRELRAGYAVHWPRVKDADRSVRFDQRMGIMNRALRVDWTHAGEGEDAVAMRAQVEQEKKEAYRNYGRGPPRGGGGGDDGEGAEDDEKKATFRTVTQARIEPYAETNGIKAPGWYRLCVTSERHGLLVEMEMRSGNRLGGVDRETGHVYTYEEREMLDEEGRINEDLTASEESLLDANTYASFHAEAQKEIENQVKEEDMHATKAQVKHLNTLVMEMKKKHQEYRHRIKSHEASARKNYDNLTWSSRLHTFMYVVIGGVQVYTVRRWLLGNTMLGR